MIIALFTSSEFYGLKQVDFELLNKGTIIHFFI